MLQTDYLSTNDLVYIIRYIINDNFICKYSARKFILE